MTMIRAAKYLNGTDTGKRIQTADMPHPQRLVRVSHTRHGVEIVTSDLHNIPTKTIMGHDIEVTITGQPSPPTDDPHGINTRRTP